MVEKDNKKINKLLFLYYIVAIMPTLFLGLLNIVDKYKTFIWMWDVLVIGLFFIINVLYVKRINKKMLFLSSVFLFIISLQFFVYKSSMESGLIEPIYMVLPIIYFIHFVSILVFLSHKKVEKIDLSPFFKYFLLFVMFACIFNVLKNYSLMFSISNITSKYVNISSFFDHRNAFGQLLFLGTIANIFLLQKENKKVYILSLVIIFINLLFSFSRTAIFSTLIFLFIFYYKKYFNLKSKKNVFIVISIVVIGLIILLFLKNETVLSFIENFVLRKEDGLTGRDTLWQVCLHRLSGTRIIYGYGLGSTNKIMSMYNLTNSHNTIIELLLSGGIILLSFYFIIYGIVFKSILKIKDVNIKKLYMAFLISFFAYSLFEKIIVFGTGYAPVLFTIFVIAIPNLYANNE